MAYAVGISLMNTIQRLLNSPRISIVSPSREILKSAYKDVKSVRKVLKRLDESRNSTERVKALEVQIREATCKLEDVIESHVSDQFLSQSERNSVAGDEGCWWILCLDLEELRQEINFCVEMLMRLRKELRRMLKQEIHMKECSKEVDNPLPGEEDAAVGGQNSKMVGLSDEFHNIISDLLSISSGHMSIKIVGMAGIGKTMLAKKIFGDPLILQSFECRAFVKVGQKYQLNEIQQAILDQVDPDSDIMDIGKSLRGRRFLIVLDDVWNAQLCHELIGESLPIEGNGSWVLVTTRLQQVATSISEYFIYNMRFLNKEESWDLLRGKVFDEEGCPPQLEKAGKKIAENCEGLPLLILSVADLLSKAVMTSEYWNKVAQKQNSVFEDSCDQILKVLYPSYNYLPQYLKACFLYMGAFPQNYEVRPSRLINLWSAEGFLEPYPSQSLSDLAKECIRELVDSSLVMNKGRRYGVKVKACSLHSVFRHLCKKEARNNKFLHCLDRYMDHLAEGIDTERRVSIYKNTLLGIKEVRNSVASISTVRSLLCTDPHHQYQVPICFHLRLLRVLDTLTIRFYEFPIDVLKLIQLRYLALTYNGNLPTSISKLWNLQYLIIHQHLSIKLTVAESYLPVDIWDLQELKYLHIMGRNLPDPDGAVLPNLITLLDVGAHSCTKSVLKRIPNLEKLRVRIELAPDVAEILISCFDHISHLHDLKSLKCVVRNPKLESNVVTQTYPPLTLPIYLKKLTLSGFGYPWKDMCKIAELPSLQVLKLQCYAFRGEKWEAEKGPRFFSLEYLSIEDTDLVQWTANYGTFPMLSYLTVKNCYKLHEIPRISSLREIQLVDCNPPAVTWAQKVESFYPQVYSYSSWDDGNL